MCATIFLGCGGQVRFVARPVESTVLYGHDLLRGGRVWFHGSLHNVKRVPIRVAARPDAFIRIDTATVDGSSLAPVVYEDDALQVDPIPGTAVAEIEVPSGGKYEFKFTAAAVPMRVGESVMVEIFKPKRPGRYRLWFRYSKGDVDAVSNEVVLDAK
jgi:hypothetical protein